MNKKSIAIPTLVGLIILIVVAIILFLPLTSFSKEMNEAWERTSCENSVLQQSLIKELPSIASSALHPGPDCYTFDITFFKDHAESSVFLNNKEKKRDYYIGIPSVKSTKYKELTSEIVNYVVAEELLSCWRQFLYGKRNIFKDNSPIWFDWGNNNLFGFICNNIRFSQEDFPKNQVFTGFYDYIKFAKPKNSVDGRTYYDFIINNSRICYAYDEQLKDDIYLNERESLIDYLNQKYSYGLAKDHEISGLSSLPPDACWHFFIDGAPTVQEGYFYEQHNIIEKDIVFETSKAYAIVFIRMGEDKEKDTYFAYVIPSSSLNKIGLEIIA